MRGAILVKKPVSVFVSIMTIGSCAFASLGQAEVVRACQVQNPPANCETMWAVIAHVRLPKQPITAVNPPPRCGSKFDSVNWGMIVAEAFKAEVDPDILDNLAMDVSDALQKKTIPQITRHIGGDAATLIESDFSKLAPRAWSPSAALYNQTLCGPVIAIVPDNATVREFRFRAWDENLGEMACISGKDCSIGYSRFTKGTRAAKTSINGITLYIAIFQNWSTDWPREGRLTIFFEMPDGRVPLQHN
jgi:hypothetical protein